MADNRHISEEYAKIGAELVRTEPVLSDIRDSDAIIVYLASDLEKKDGEERIVYGECERIKDKYKWGLPADFTITLFEPNLQGKSREAIRRIIFHELLHVGIGVGKEEMEQYYVRKHDIEDFKYLIDRYGTDWASVDDEPACEIEVEDLKIMDKYDKLQAAINDVYNNGNMTEEEYVTLCNVVKELQEKEVDDGK